MSSVLSAAQKATKPFFSACSPPGFLHPLPPLFLNHPPPFPLPQHALLFQHPETKAETLYIEREMGKFDRRREVWVVVALVLWCALGAVAADWRGEDEREWRGEDERGWEEEGEGKSKDMFLLQETRHVVKTDAGQMKMVRSYGGRIVERPLHIGFITMEPRSLFIPQYLDSSLILFVRRGEARIGSIQNDELVERNLRAGHIYRIPAGSVFYLLNTGRGQRLHIICSIDPSESLGMGSPFQSFYVGGGINPISILEGFGPRTLSAAFNVSIEELKEVMTRQDQGPIVYTDRHPSIWSEFVKLKEQDKLKHMKKMAGSRSSADEDGEEEEEEQQRTWSWRKLLNPFTRVENKKSRKSKKSSEPFNLYDKKPDFKNSYGWSVAVDQSDYSPLKKSGVGVYLVNLTAGSMMAPHLNPTATEYGIVLSGSGSIQVVFPNGTGTDARVEQNNVFWIPKFFPFCQVASRTGPLEFFGFTTSSHRNHPQFLIGSNSLLNQIRGPEIAAAFGVSEERFRRVASAQREAVIIPSTFASPGDGDKRRAPATEAAEEQKMEKAAKVIKSFGGEMVMGLD